MSNRVKAVVITLCMLFVAAVVAKPASANTILVFGQNGTTNTITGTANGSGTQTTISGTNVAITISAIDAALATPLSAFFTLSATSLGAATACFGGNTCQEYSGTFSIYSGANQTGTNYLSGTFTDATFGSGASLTM